MLATINSGAYKFVFLLHIASIIAGIGTVCLNGIYGAKIAKKKGVEGLAISDANFEVSTVAEYIIYTIPIWGLALVGMSDKVWKFSQSWVWLSLLLYLVAIGLSHGVLVPTHKRNNELMR